MLHEDPALALDLQAQAMLESFVAGWPERAFAEAQWIVKDLPPVGAPYEPFLRAFLGAMAAQGARKEALRQQLVETLEGAARTGDLRFAAWAAFASIYLGDMRSAREIAKRVVASARAAGSFNTLPRALLGVARMAVRFRDFDEAEEAAREGIEITRQFAQENQETCFSAILVCCLAAWGQIDECRELGQATLQRALARGIAVAAADVRLGLAELELSLANGVAAHDHLGAIAHPLLSLAAAPYLVEASVLIGELQPARRAIEVMAEFAAQSEEPLVLGLVARSRALLAESADAAESLFLEALRYQTEHPQPFERARTRLAYGEFLRRQQRKVEARAQLRDSLTTFEGLEFSTLGPEGAC